VSPGLPQPRVPPGTEAGAKARSIVLIGMMGSGKSAVGGALASRLRRELIDLDALVEATAGRSVAEIFAEEGEAGFRRREAAAVAEAVRRPGAVIACGGGVVLDPASVALLRDAGAVIWLQVTPRIAAQRLGSDAGRPVLGAMTGDLGDRLAVLNAARGPAYAAAAHIAIDGDADVETVAGRVLAVVASAPAAAAS
jgi:shikimate kinase